MFSTLGQSSSGDGSCLLCFTPTENGQMNFLVIKTGADHDDRASGSLIDSVIDPAIKFEDGHVTVMAKANKRVQVKVKLSDNYAGAIKLIARQVATNEV